MIALSVVTRSGTPDTMQAEPNRPWEVLLIGGVSGAGKSTAAAELARRLAIPWLGVDDLRLALQWSRVSLPERTEELYFFLDTPAVWTLPPERLRDALIAIAEIMSPAVEIVTESHLFTGVPLIIEGDGIHPALLARETLQSRAANGRLRAVFVHEPDENALFANYLDRERGIDAQAEAELRNEARAKTLFSAWIAREAERYGLPVIPSRPFETLGDRIALAAQPGRAGSALSFDRSPARKEPRMATTAASRPAYRVRLIERIGNAFMKGMIRIGLKPNTTYILSVPGRKSGKLHSTPVTLVEEGGKRWLVAPYGEVNWVKNVRAAGKAGLTRGRKSEIVPVTELGPEEAAPVLKMYIERVPITRRYFDNGADAPTEAFVSEAHRHPVFRLD